MSVEKVNTLVVGAGQAGIAASEHLTNNGISHLVWNGLASLNVGVHHDGTLW